jgi:hypothetical protein|tara:strand:+ start:341 stop:724 length:384 start_codon:yes stop_codon:yes gene_type:complete
LFLDSFRFHIPNADVRAEERLDDEVVQILVLLRSRWIDWGTQCFMVTTDVLIKEMRVAELGIAPGAETFVVPFFLVKKLMSNDSTHSSKEAEDEGELEILSVGFWFSLEPCIWKIDLITDHNQGPYP